MRTDALDAYTWPGNVREHAIERALVLCRGEREALRSAIERCGGSSSRVVASSGSGEQPSTER